MEWTTTNFTDAAAVIDLLDRAAEACRRDAFRDRSVVRLPRRGWLLATGDLHDNPPHLQTILRVIGLDRAPDRHVILHELIHGENLINGMDFSHRMLLRVAELKCAYANQVHPLLANHELAQMTGQGVSKGAGDAVVMFQDAIDYTFGDEAEAVTEAMNRFLRAWPLALITESGVLCAHSVPSVHAMEKFDPAVLERDLTVDDYRPGTGSACLMVWGRNHTAAHLDRLAEVFGVRAFCLGHERAEIGYELLPGDRGIVLNSDHEHAAVLPLDLSADPNPAEWPWAVKPLRSLMGL